MTIQRKATDEGNSYVFEIMGDEYVVKGADKPEYMEEIIRHLESVIQNVMSANPKLTKSQIAVLAALKIADEFYKLRQEYQGMEQKKSEVRSQKPEVNQLKSDVRS